MSAVVTVAPLPFMSSVSLRNAFWVEELTPSVGTWVQSSVLAASIVGFEVPS